MTCSTSSATVSSSTSIGGREDDDKKLPIIHVYLLKTGPITSEEEEQDEVIKVMNVLNNCYFADTPIEIRFPNVMDRDMKYVSDYDNFIVCDKKVCPVPSQHFTSIEGTRYAVKKGFLFKRLNNPWVIVYPNEPNVWKILCYFFKTPLVTSITHDIAIFKPQTNFNDLTVDTSKVLAGFLS